MTADPADAGNHTQLLVEALKLGFTATDLNACMCAEPPMNVLICISSEHAAVAATKSHIKKYKVLAKHILSRFKSFVPGHQKQLL